MIDLYKQTEQQKSSLRDYTPVHIAAVLTVLLVSLNFLHPGGIPFPAASETSSTGNGMSQALYGGNALPFSSESAVGGDGLGSPIFVSDDLLLDPTVLPEDRLFWKNQDPETLVDLLIEDMSDEEIVSQVFLLGWESEGADGPIMDWISQRGVGGVKIFGWNGNNLQTLARTMNTMQQVSLDSPHGIPLFTATDQEGGWVRHIKDTTSITPGNMAIGASALPMDSYLSGYYIGRQLRAVGVNMNFAPTVDVYVNNEAHVIGPRAFSADPLETSLLGLAFFQGMQQSGVIATAKHFPGHGNALGDSHGYLPVIEDEFDIVWERDLLPYRMMIPEGLPAVLSGHLNFPLITGDGRPASLSTYFKKQVLRDKLNFQGIVITDDLYMGGAMNYGDQEQWGMDRIVLEALRAGNDMVMLSRTPAINDSIWSLVLETYQADEEFANQVRQSVRRILRIKLMYLKPQWRVPLTLDPQQVYQEIEDYSGQPFFQEQAARGVTLIRDEHIPFVPEEGERVLLVGQDFDFIRAGEQSYPGSRSYQFSYSPFYTAEPEVISEIARIAPAYDRIVFNLANPNSLEVLRSLEAYKDRIIVFSSLTPVYLEDLPWVDSAIAVYGWGTESFEAGFAALRGDIPFRGSLPVLLSSADDLRGSGTGISGEQ
jgi:beta-N-acetylhexosaminidase